VLEETPRVDLHLASEADRIQASALAGRAGLPLPGDDEGPRDVMVGVQADEERASSVVTTASLFRIGEAAVIRSVAVADDARGRGLGTLIMSAVVRRAREGGAAAGYAFTETAAGFFTSMGFRAVSRPDLPAEVRQSRHAAGVCAPAQAFVLGLRPHPG
jgi:GNAT superfamily N-acetyltransferase